jgi:hypothetical protein
MTFPNNLIFFTFSPLIIKFYPIFTKNLYVMTNDEKKHALKIIAFVLLAIAMCFADNIF